MAEQQRQIAQILCAQKGDADAMECIVLEYLPLIRSVARRFGVYRQTCESDDLVQAGTVGFLQAVLRYDICSSARLSTYAIPWILGEMKRAIRLSKGNCGVEAAKAKLRREQDRLTETLGHAPNLGELAKACDISQLQAAELTALCSETMVMEALHTQADQERQEAIEIRLGLEKLSQVERSVILLRYFRDQTQKQTAAFLGKSQTQVSRIEQSALQNLKRQLS